MAERALLDTGVLVAFLHRDDQAHQASREALRRFRGILLTTEFVLTESASLLGRVPGGAAACLDRRGFANYRTRRGRRFEIRP